MKVFCANCLKAVEDGGKGYTCPVCGMSPVPSYSYDKASPFHPDNCDCSLENKAKPTVVRTRRYPLPTKPKL